MSFVCPQCGGSAFKSLKQKGIGYERSCEGAVIDRRLTNNRGQSVTLPEDVSDTSRERNWSHRRRCTFTFLPSDDGRYGITPEEAQQSEREADERAAKAAAEAEQA